jgi:hypothetical protein
MKMRTPTGVTYTEYYDLDGDIGGEMDITLKNHIRYCRQSAPQFVETLEIHLFNYADSLRGRYRITRKIEDGESQIIRFFNRCSPGQGCKIDTERVSSLPKEITDFLREFPKNIRDIAGIR